MLDFYALHYKKGQGESRLPPSNPGSPQCKRMLVQSAVDLEKIQYVYGEKPPDPAVYGDVYCLVCQVRMRSLGWRERNLVEDKNHGMKIWIRRVYCPKCGRSMSVEPLEVHPYRIYRAKKILEVVSYRLSHGSFPKDSGVIRETMKSWYNAFLRNQLKHEACPTRQTLCQALQESPGGCAALTDRVHVVRAVPVVLMHLRHVLGLRIQMRMANRGKRAKRNVAPAGILDRARAGVHPTICWYCPPGVV